MNENEELMIKFRTYGKIALVIGIIHLVLGVFWLLFALSDTFGNIVISLPIIGELLEFSSEFQELSLIYKIMLPVIGIILGIRALVAEKKEEKRTNEVNKKYKKIARAAIITNVLGILFITYVIILFERGMGLA